MKPSSLIQIVNIHTTTHRRRTPATRNIWRAMARSSGLMATMITCGFVTAAQNLYTANTKSQAATICANGELSETQRYALCAPRTTAFGCQSGMLQSTPPLVRACRVVCLTPFDS